MTVKSNLSKMSLQFKDGFMEASEETVRATAITAWRSIIYMSPVDEGRFRSNWFASKTPSTQVTSTKSAESTVINRAANAVMNQSSWNQFTLSNNLPYAQSLSMAVTMMGLKL